MGNIPIRRLHLAGDKSGTGTGGVPTGRDTVSRGCHDVPVRFVAVRCGKDGNGYCTLCCTALEKSYVRDIPTRLPYHNYWCWSTHID